MQTAHPTTSHGRRSASRHVGAPSGRAGATLQVVRLSLQNRIAVGVTALALVAGLSIAPTEPAQAVTVMAPSQTGIDTSTTSPVVQHPAAQTFEVDANVVAPPITRDTTEATDGVQTLANNGTNADWAKLVLMDGGWPQTEQNITVLLRWMRQENGPPDWWNRNNPLNNGYGSGGGAGLGSYDTLRDAAQYAALNLQRGYPGIVAGLTAGTSADATAQAIWASPWATSHYANGAHWSTAPVPIVKAPASAWGG